MAARDEGAIPAFNVNESAAGPLPQVQKSRRPSSGHMKRSENPVKATPRTCRI